MTEYNIKKVQMNIKCGKATGIDEIPAALDKKLGKDNSQLTVK